MSSTMKVSIIQIILVSGLLCPSIWLAGSHIIYWFLEVIKCHKCQSQFSFFSAVKYIVISENRMYIPK